MSERLGYLASIETLRACFAEACVKRAMAELRAEQAESRLAEIEAAPPVVEVDDAMCDRAYIRKWENQPSLSGVEPDDEDRQWALEWLTAWRAELGPQLGLVTREELARQVEAAYREGYLCDYTMDKNMDSCWEQSNARKRLEGGE